MDTDIGTTVTLRTYPNAHGDNVDGQVFFEHWTDRSVKQNAEPPRRPPDAIAVFSISESRLSKAERDGVIAHVQRGIDRQLSEGRTEDFGWWFVKGNAIRKGPGLKDLDPEPLVLVNRHGDDPLYRVVHDGLTDSKDQMRRPCEVSVDDCWLVYYDRVVGPRLREAVAVYHGARHFKIRKRLVVSRSEKQTGIMAKLRRFLSMSQHSEEFSGTEGHFSTLDLVKDENGVYVALYAPLQDVDRTDWKANQYVNNLPVATVMGADVARPSDSAQIYAPHLYAITKAFMIDHDVATAGEELFATSGAVAALLKMTSPEYLATVHESADPRPQIKVVNAILKNVEWPCLNLCGKAIESGNSGLVVNCRIADSEIDCCADYVVFGNCHVTNSTITFCRFQAFSEDEILPARNVHFVGGLWDSSVTLAGAIESGRIDCAAFVANVSKLQLSDSFEIRQRRTGR